jgi:hypothetical protein
MLNGGSGTDGADRAFQPCVEMMLFRLMELELELEQIMLRLGAGYNGGKEEIDALSYRDESSINEEGINAISIPAHLHQVLLGPRTKAFMANPAARPAVERTVEANDKSTICADCGASTTITGSLANTTDVVEKETIVDMAESGARMKATHTCMKTYFLRNRTGELVTITTPALYVRNIHQDLLSGKACNRAKIRIILDMDQDIAGLYPLDENNQPHIEESIPFISEPTDLFLLKIETMDWRRFHELNGYDLWHRRMMHCPNRNIRESIPFTKGMEKLLKYRYDHNEKCPGCMIGKSCRQDVPGPAKRADRPLGKVTFDLIISTITSVEGYNAAALFVDDHTGRRWLYGCKTKDEALDASKRWMAEISDLRAKYPLLVVMRDNAGENKSKEICDYFTSMEVANRFSTAYEQHQDGLSESGVKSLFLLVRSAMAESGLAGKYWFCAANCAKDCRNAMYVDRIKNSPWGLMYGEKRDVSKFRPFGCRAWMFLNKDRREKGKTAPRAVEVVNLGFASDLNTSSYKVLIKETGQILTSNQLEFDEGFFPYRKEELVAKLGDMDEEIDILYRASAPIRWLEYDPSLPLATFKKVDMGSGRQLILQSPTDSNAYLKIDQETFFKNLLATTTVHEKAMLVVGPLQTRIKGLPDHIDASRPPKNFRDAMQREDSQEWAEALDKEYMGFKQRGVFELVPLQKGTKLMGMTTRWEYKVTNGTFEKRKVRLCAMGNQQVAGVHFNESDLYAPVLKAHEVRLLVAIAAQRGATMYKYDTSQAFLYGDVDEELYARAPDWWPELVPEGHCLRLRKNIYGTRQAARAWHLRLSTWMEENEYLPVNNEKTIFMKWEGQEFILIGVFVDDFSAIPTTQKLKIEFETLYAKEFDMTGGTPMESFLGLEVEQGNDGISLHLDTYIQELIDEYRLIHRKFIKPKTVPMSPGVVLDSTDCPELPDPVKQKLFRSMVAKVQFAAYWTRFDISYPAAQLARFCASAGPSHWAALTHLIGYLIHRPSLKIKYWKGVGGGLDGFADSDWGNSVSRKSTTGLVARYNRTPILWRSRMQKTVALSSAESEYYSASEMAVEMIYLRNLLDNMRFAAGDNTTVFEDNTACIEWSNHIMGGRERAKHIDIRKHFAHEAVQNGHIRLIKIPTEFQLADLLTKGLNRRKFERCLYSLLGEDPPLAGGTT